MARPSRLRACAFLAAAVAALVVCVLADGRFRPDGAVRIAMWSAGIVVYGLLLRCVAGPVVDHRERSR